MTQMMQAAVVRELGKPLVIETRPIPEPGPGQLLIRLAASGVCHTDLHAASGDWPVKPRPPFIPGHEGVGTVVARGSGALRIQLGERVGVPWLHAACGHCPHCLGAWETLCESQTNTGYSVDGTFAGYVLAEEDYVVPIPNGLGVYEAAPILCAGLTVYKALKVSGAKPGDTVAISGIGGLGHLAIQYALVMGFIVAALDIDPKKLRLAEALGASFCINANGAIEFETLKRRTRPIKAVIVTAPSLPAFTQAIELVGRGGTVVLAGLPAGDFPLSVFDTVIRGITVRGSIVGTRLDLQEALALAADGRVCSVLDIRPLAAINEIFDEMRRGTIEGRVVLDLMEAEVQVAKLAEKTGVAEQLAGATA